MAIKRIIPVIIIVAFFISLFPVSGSPTEPIAEDLPGVLFNQTIILDESWNNFSISLTGFGWYSYYVTRSSMWSGIDMILDNGSVFFEWQSWTDYKGYFHGVDELFVSCRGSESVKIIIAELTSVSLEIPDYILAEQEIELIFLRSYLLSGASLIYYLLNENGSVYGTVIDDQINLIYTWSSDLQVILTCSLPSAKYFVYVELVDDITDINFRTDVFLSDVFKVESAVTITVDSNYFMALFPLFILIFYQKKKE